MNKKLLITALLACTANAQAACYILRNHNGQVVYNDTQPPFDISAPPESTASIASKKAGQYLQILPDQCPTNPNANLQLERYNEAISNHERTPDMATTMALQMIKQDEEHEKRLNQIQAIERELDRYHEGVLGDVKRYNDEHEAMYPDDHR